jgi:hypothetical protein
MHKFDTELLVVKFCHTYTHVVRQTVKHSNVIQHVEVHEYTRI